MRIFTEAKFQEKIEEAIRKREHMLWLQRQNEKLAERIDKLEFELGELRFEMKGGTPTCACAQEPQR